MAARIAISIRGLSVRYPHAARPALDGLSLDIERGEVVGVLGLTDAGKTTLLRCLNGIVPQLVAADLTGSVEVAGANPATTPVRDMARAVGVVLDDPEAQLSQPTVAEEVALGLETLAVPWAEMIRRVPATLEAVGLGGFEHRSPLALSGGEQQRLAVACALAMEPAVLVLDEPTSHLDPSGKAAVTDLLERLNREHDLTVVLAEHDVELLAEHAHRIIVLDRGRLVMDGRPADVLGRWSELHAMGLGVPQVTELASIVTRDAGSRPPLPVTLDGAVAWLGRGS